MWGVVRNVGGSINRSWDKHLEGLMCPTKECRDFLEGHWKLLEDFKQ